MDRTAPTEGNQSDVEQLVRDIRRKRTLPREPALLKYDLPRALSKSQEFVIALVAVIPFIVLASFVQPSWVFVCGYFGGAVLIGWFCDWFLNRYRQPFVLLTPTHLVAAYSWRSAFFEWSKLSELGLAAEGGPGSEQIKVEDWPITWTDKDIEKRELAHMRGSDKEGLELLIEAKKKRFLEQLALDWGKRGLTFTYDGRWHFVEIPVGVDIETLAKFVNQYWTKLNPGARKKGIIYL